MQHCTRHHLLRARFPYPFYRPARISPGMAHTQWSTALLFWRRVLAWLHRATSPPYSAGVKRNLTPPAYGAPQRHLFSDVVAGAHCLPWHLFARLATASSSTSLLPVLHYSPEHAILLLPAPMTLLLTWWVLRHCLLLDSYTPLFSGRNSLQHYYRPRGSHRRLPWTGRHGGCGQFNAARRVLPRAQAERAPAAARRVHTFPTATYLTPSACRRASL